MLYALCTPVSVCTYILLCGHVCVCTCVCPSPTEQKAKSRNRGEDHSCSFASSKEPPVLPKANSLDCSLNGKRKSTWKPCS